MAPWITLGVTAVLGAVVGGPGGFVVGLLLGLAFNLTVGALYNKARTRAQQNAGAEWLHRAGAPPPPYPLDPRDRVCAQRLASMLPGSVIRETQGNFGPQLELVMPALSQEPLAVFSRTWDPDKRRVGTLLMCSGDVEPPIIQAAAESGLEKVDMPGHIRCLRGSELPGGRTLRAWQGWLVEMTPCRRHTTPLENRCCS